MLAGAPLRLPDQASICDGQDQIIRAMRAQLQDIRQTTALRKLMTDCLGTAVYIHDDVIKWKHFPRY